MTSLTELRINYAVFGVQDAPAGYMPDMPVTIRAFAAPGTTFVEGFNAVLNIVYTFVGQILIPSYVDDMKQVKYFEPEWLLPYLRLDAHSTARRFSKSIIPSDSA